jgi:excisionase family DNA binding protein
MEDRFWSVDEVSGYLGIKRDTVYKWIDRRNLPAHKLGRLWKFRRREVDDWVSSLESSRQARHSHARGNDARRQMSTKRGRD